MAISLSMLALYIAASATIGTLYFRRLAGYDRTTAFFSATPGGLSEMILVGSRFFDAIQRQSKRPLGRMRNEREFTTQDRRDHRPVPHRERGF